MNLKQFLPHNKTWLPASWVVCSIKHDCSALFELAILSLSQVNENIYFLYFNLRPLSKTNRQNVLISFNFYLNTLNRHLDMKPQYSQYGYERTFTSWRILGYMSVISSAVLLLNMHSNKMPSSHIHVCKPCTITRCDSCVSINQGGKPY